MRRTTCHECSCWEPLGPLPADRPGQAHDIGECRRMSPRPALVVLECLRAGAAAMAPPIHRGGARAVWPETHRHDGCFDGQKRERGL